MSANLDGTLAFKLQYFNFEALSVFHSFFYVYVFWS